MANEKWDKRLHNLLAEAIIKGRIDSVAIVEKVFQEESETGRAILAKSHINRELGLKLNRWPSQEDPLIPELLNGYAKVDGGFIHISRLARKEILHRRNRLQARIFALTARVAAYDALLEEDLPLEGSA